MLARATRKRRGQGGDKHSAEFNVPLEPEGSDDGFKDGADVEIKPKRRKKNIYSYCKFFVSNDANIMVILY